MWSVGVILFWFNVEICFRLQIKSLLKLLFGLGQFLLAEVKPDEQAIKRVTDR